MDTALKHLRCDLIIKFEMLESFTTIGLDQPMFFNTARRIFRCSDLYDKKNTFSCFHEFRKCHGTAMLHAKASCRPVPSNHHPLPGASGSVAGQCLMCAGTLFSWPALGLHTEVQGLAVGEPDAL